MDNRDIIVTEELKEISPFIGGLPKIIRNDVPEGYFEDVESQILSQLSIALEDGDCKLQIPEGYFETLENRIITIIHRDKIRKTYDLKYFIYHKISKIAAALVFVLGAVFLLTYNSQTGDAEIVLDDDWDEVDLWEYLANNTDDISLNILIENGLVEESDLLVTKY